MPAKSPLLAHVKALLLDMDGTLYRGRDVITQTPAFLDELRRRGLPFLCVTNNSSGRAITYAEKLHKMGVRIQSDEILTSGEATVHYLRAHTTHHTAYVLGTDALRQEFELAGIAHEEQSPDCLVVGYDTTLTYEKICIATRLLFANVPYFATHPDITFITESGLVPDVGATLVGLELVTHRKPTVIGKPEHPILDAALARLKCPASAVAMVGDKLATDMAFAQKQHLVGVLVLSGETRREHLATSSVQPTLVIEDVGELIDYLH